jgi:hypothetical protein
MSSPMFASKVLTSLGMKKEFYEIATRNKCYKKVLLSTEKRQINSSILKLFQVWSNVCKEGTNIISDEERVL